MRTVTAIALAGLVHSFCPQPAFAQPAPSAMSEFPAGAKYAYVDLNRVVSLSTEGKALSAKLEKFRSQKDAEVDRRAQEVEALQAKLAADVLSDAARTQLQREFERARVDFQRFSQDAQAEIQELQEQMQISFGKRLFPVIGQIAKEKDLWAVFSAASPLLWHDPKLDLSAEVAKRLDVAANPAKP